MPRSALGVVVVRLGEGTTVVHDPRGVDEEDVVALPRQSLGEFDGVSRVLVLDVGGDGSAVRRARRPLVVDGRTEQAVDPSGAVGTQGGVGLRASRPPRPGAGVRRFRASCSVVTHFLRSDRHALEVLVAPQVWTTPKTRPGPTRAAATTHQKVPTVLRLLSHPFLTPLPFGGVA